MTPEILYSLLYLEINIFSAILVAIIALMSHGVSRMVEQRTFTRTLYSMIIFFASDTLCVIMKNGLVPYSEQVYLFSKDIYFLFTALMCFAWFVYFEYLQDSPFVKSVRDMWLSSVFVVIQLILILINKFTNILYYINENGEYTRGPFFVCLYILAYVYVAFSCSRALFGLISGRSHVDKRRLIMLAAFPVLPGLGGLVQYIAPELPVVCGVLSITALVLYLDWLSRMISVDPLTQLKNRKQLNYDYEQMLKNNDDETPIYLLMIDANKFKEINDTYGHIEGDAALVRIAEALRNGCRVSGRRVTIARYGGDEFVVITRTSDEDSIKLLADSIREELSKLNDKAGSPYRVSVSIGYASAGHDEKVPLKDLIETADEKLYEEKKNRK